VVVPRRLVRRPTQSARLYSMRVTRKRTRRARRLLVRAARRARWLRRQKVTHLLAPTVFGLERQETLVELVQFLAALRRVVGIERRRARIDFAQTRLMTAGGTLLFAAELARLNEIVGAQMISCSYPSDGVVAQVLKQVGIFDLLAQRRPCPVTADNVKYWRVASGTDVDTERLKETLEYYSTLFSDPESQTLYKALSEAMTNSHQHAYKRDRGDGLPTVKGWWSFTQLLDKKLTVAFCDLGIGIPRSLREDLSGLGGTIRRLADTFQWGQGDAGLIQAAMEYGRTRTGKGNRGKGMRDIRTVLDALGGKLQIHSNAGFFEFRAQEKRERCKTFKEWMSIKGTLVIWQLDMPEAKP